MGVHPEVSKTLVQIGTRVPKDVSLRLRGMSQCSVVGGTRGWMESYPSPERERRET